MSTTPFERNPLVSIIILTYNSENDIVDCVNSVLRQDYQNIEIVIVDNNSTDNTVKVVQDNFGQNMKVRLIVNPQNSGYAGGNNVGFDHASGEMIVILNPDTVVDKLWLVELLDTYYRHEQDAGLVCSNILHYDRPDVVNASGNDIHITGLVFSRQYNEKLDSAAGKDTAVAAPSGASMMFARIKLSAIGKSAPFDSDRFFMEYSDIDLAIEFLKKGLVCYVSARSKVLHKYKFKMNPKRLYFLETGRYQILGHLRKRTIFRLLPALILTELIVWSYILGKDRMLARSKLGAQAWLFRNWASLDRKNNNKATDLELIQRTITDIMIYKELGDREKIEGLHRASNRFFAFVKRSVIKSLGSV